MCINVSLPIVLGAKFMTILLWQPIDMNTVVVLCVHPSVQCPVSSVQQHTCNKYTVNGAGTDSLTNDSDKPAACLHGLSEVGSHQRQNLGQDIVHQLCCHRARLPAWRRSLIITCLSMYKIHSTKLLLSFTRGSSQSLFRVYKSL